jgi:hypothetical protein
MFASDFESVCRYHILDFNCNMIIWCNILSLSFTTTYHDGFRYRHRHNHRCPLDATTPTILDPYRVSP